MLLRSTWGMRGLIGRDPAPILASVRRDHFHGLEASLADIGRTQEERLGVVRAMEAEGLSLVLSAYSSWPNYEGPYDARRSVSEHAQHFIAELQQIAELAAAAPKSVLRVNGHSGSDAWTEAEALDFYGAVSQASPSIAPPPVSHETHRGRYLCCPFATARLLRALPELRLTSDFSHWYIAHTNGHASRRATTQMTDTCLHAS